MLSCDRDIYGLVRQYSVCTLSGKFIVYFLRQFEAFDNPSTPNDLFHVQLNEDPGGSCSPYIHGTEKGYEKKNHSASTKGGKPILQLILQDNQLSSSEP